MTPFVIATVLAAALLHATWNALLRGGADRRWSMTVISATMTVLAAGLLPVARDPGAAGWAYAVFSGVLHIGYFLALMRMYRSGELGQTYPVARGVSPVLVTLGAAAFAGEIPGALSGIGLALVSGGILALAVRRGRLDRQSIPAAVLAGVFIGAYSVTDGLGVRASADPLGYIAASNALSGGFTLLVLRAIPALRGSPARWVDTAKAAAGGAGALVAYGAIIWAMDHAPLGPVAALRETSAVFAVLIGRVFLGESLTQRRLGACVAVAAGAACLGIARVPH